jgi:hypothetical protein
MEKIDNGLAQRAGQLAGHKPLNLKWRKLIMDSSSVLANRLDTNRST